MAKRYEITEAIWKNVSGDIFTGDSASATINDLRGNALTLYTTATGGTTTANPITADSNGRIEAWVDAPDYDIVIPIQTGFTSAYTQQVRSGLYTDIRSYGAVTTATDNAVNIQAAIDARAADGGGYVVIPPGIWITSQLVLKENVYLVGEGKASCLKLKNATNNTLIINHVSTNGTTDPNAQHCGLYNLMLDGNKANQTTGTAHGIFLDQNPDWSIASSDTTFDPNYRIFNLWIINTRTDGINIPDGRSAANIYGLNMLGCDGYGIRMVADGLVVNCNIGMSGLAGVRISGNTFLSNVYSYYSGQVSTSPGFELPISQHSVLNNCRAQDNTGAGFNFNGTSRVILNGCVADTNSTAVDGALPGFDLFGATYNQLMNCMSTDRTTTPSQVNAIRIRSTSINNRIDLVHSSSGAGTVGAVIQTLDTNCKNNYMRFQNEDGFDAFTFAASYTPDPYGGWEKATTLTANITINNPTIGHAGSKLRFILTQDGTGGRTTTFGSAFKSSWTPNTAAGKINVIEFVYDGTNWNQIAATVGL